MSMSYTSNYLRIYLWQTVAIVLNFLSMLIVTPCLSELPTIYGIYSFCIATSIFFTYADLGFLSAGYKYVSESFARKDMEEEIKIMGFVSFILFIFVLLYTFAIIFIAVDPRILIRNLNSQEEFKIASRLLWIMAFFSPTVIFQRFLQTVCGVRLEDFIYQRISILSSAIKLVSVFYFFHSAHYDIVGYFFFSQLINLLGSIFTVFIIKTRYHYDFSLLIRSLKFSVKIYKKMKNLAFSSLYMTFTFVLFFELDLILIAKLLGPEPTAFYAIGLTLSSIFRSIYGVLYGPFVARFNHLVGLKAHEELKDFYQNVIILTMPLIIFPLLSVVLLMRPFIYSWVSHHYAPSLIIGKFLSLCFIYGFLSYPASILIIAREKIKLLYLISTIQMFIFWAGVLATYQIFGINSFALFKFIAFTISAAVYLYISLNFMELKLIEFLKKIMNPIIVPSLFLVISLLYLNKFMPLEKNKVNLLRVITTGGGICFLATWLYYLFSIPFRRYINQIFGKIPYFQNFAVSANKINY